MLHKNEKGKSRVELYVSALPNLPLGYPLYPQEREDEIRSLSDEVSQREKYFAWRLLERAVRDSLGLELSELGLRRKNGKWCSDRAELSISHSGDALAVAVSSIPVGVDIEPIGNKIRDGVARRFFSKDEFSTYLSADSDMREEVFLRIWTAKEAVFKSTGDVAFAPSSVDTATLSVYTEKIDVEGREYVVAAYCDGDFEVDLHRITLN